MVKKVLSINQSDSTGKTGVQSDLVFFQNLNVFGFTVITAINTDNSHQLELVDDLTIKKQLETVFATGQIDGIKLSSIGSLSSINIIKEFIDTFKVKHLIYEVSYSDLKKEIAQTVISTLSPIVVLTDFPTDNGYSLEYLARDIFIKKMLYLILPTSMHEDNFLIFNGDNFEEISVKTDNIAAYLTAELAIYQSLFHLQNIDK